MENSNGRAGLWSQIVVALISAAGTIAVAWIGILPTLREGDLAEIARLDSDVETLKSKLGQYVANPDSTETWIIKGTLEDLSSETPAPIRRAWIALLPLGNEKLQASTDEQGFFVFSGVPTGHYFLIVEPEGKPPHRGTIEAREIANRNIAFEATTVKYEVEREFGE
jgi:hypothetical protein